MPAPLSIEDFGTGDALDRIGSSQQQKYLRCYFADLGALTVVEEPAYFDRDYLSEFAAFYSTSAREYSNRCRRIHFFARKVTREDVVAAASGDKTLHEDLQDKYLGFIVVRPIPAAPLGRVVARWYPDDERATTPRIVDPARDYTCHLAGITLRVNGLVWQQQDSAVGACATVALWTLLHSSAFDETHAVPSTADITRFAHRTASLGSRIFPATGGLRAEQVLEAIKEAGLAPVVLAGDLRKDGEPRFSRPRFATSCASLIRSGFPVILLGTVKGAGGHAICAVGFREAAAVLAKAGAYEFQDERIQRLYINDDNIGPNARFTITSPTGYVTLERAVPKKSGQKWPDPTHPWPSFTPQFIIAAVPDGIRTSPVALQNAALRAAAELASAIAQQGVKTGITLTTRFIKLADYYRELGERLAGAPDAIGKVRLGLAEQVAPMSLYVALARLGEGSSPHVDVLYDTSDSDRNMQPFCHVLFSSGAQNFADALHAKKLVDWGTPVRAY